MLISIAPDTLPLSELRDVIPSFRGAWSFLVERGGLVHVTFEGRAICKDPMQTNSRVLRDKFARPRLACACCVRKYKRLAMKRGPCEV